MHRKKCWGQLTRKREHITPVLKELHWLPVKQRIDHKIMPFGLQMLRGYGAGILAGTHSPICSCTNSASKLWNALPQTVREAEMAAFRKRLKTPVLWMTLYRVSFSSFCLWLSLYPSPIWAFKLMETSDKARHHHHHHQLKATKQSISLRQPSTTPCSHGSWNRLIWDGVVGRGVYRLPITPPHPAPWWWREGLHTSSPSESDNFSNRL